MLIYDVLHKETVYHSVVSDLRNHGVKYRFKKSMFKTERLEGMKHISKKVFKTPLSYQPLDVVNLSSGGIVHVPVFVSQASTFLEKYITQEGLFRKGGSQLRQKELMNRLDNGGTLGEKYHAVDVANCLKTFFRDLPEPLIPYTYHDLFIHCAMLKEFSIQALLLACMLLPPHHLSTLAFFMEFLKKVSMFEKQNKMSIDNLAKVVGPNIMPLQETTMSAMQTRLELHLNIVKILIENAENIGVLPDHITKVVSIETIDSTDNELDVSGSQSHSKFRKKKHRSGSLTRKPHLSASNLNLRVFNGLKKMVGKNSPSENSNNTSDNLKVPEHYDPLHSSNVKGTKKRKVEHLDHPTSKKKRNSDKTDKTKKLRLSLDRLVPKKPKINDEDAVSCMNTFDTYAERRWSCVNDKSGLERTYRTYSDGSSQLRLILKDNETSNELHKEYNNIFIDANVNLSDDNDEQDLLTEENNISKSHSRLNSRSSEELKLSNGFDQVRFYPSKKRVTVNNFETYSRVKVTSVNDESEEYVTIPKSEYEEIKNRVSAIESRLSQEFGCVNDEEKNDLSPHSVKKVQTAYEKTLEEASIESTVTADYLARKLGKELKIRRSGEHKIIRSPSARKIGTLRRRSQERMMSKRVRRTSSWHISHGSDLQAGQELDNTYLHSENYVPTNYMKDDAYLGPVATSRWKEDNNEKLDNAHKSVRDSNVHSTKQDSNFIGAEALPVKTRIYGTVRRVSSFHGNEFTATANSCSAKKIEKLKKTNSHQNISLNNTAAIKLSPKSDCWKKGTMSWKDAEGYFTLTNHTNTPVTQTGRASIAKLRTQNAGMVLAKAKLFDECTTKVYAQNAMSNKKNDPQTAKTDQTVSNSKQSYERTECTRKSSKNAKSRSSKMAVQHSADAAMETETTKLGGKDAKSYYYISQSSALKTAGTPEMTGNKRDAITDTTNHQKENMSVKTPPSTRKISPNGVLQQSRLSMYKADNNTLCRTPHIKKPLTMKTPKSAKALARKPVAEFRRTPLKAVSQYQSPKSILKTKNISRYA